ncbi:hypothetical protein GCM10010917_08430 [Paenibacillus physcomitrellae]|uniref:Uncharacterized protein n=1 Tax=Paenibacillus physcomitrellae TaxID=1619311 RepID=A0ABQ1FR33_9BACL|nr:hypothetical protein GCM10010917_08430 [Paenibacillus physcomitrellae]
MAVGVSFACKLVRVVELLSPLSASVYSLLSVAAAKLVGISDVTITKQQRNASILPNRFDLIENPPFFRSGGPRLTQIVIGHIVNLINAQRYDVAYLPGF